MGTAKAVLRGKFIALPAYLKKQEKSQVNDLTLYLKELEKEQQSRVSRRKKIIKVRAEINNMGKKKDQWNPEPVFQKEKQYWQTFNQTHQEKKREDPNKYNRK